MATASLRAESAHVIRTNRFAPAAAARIATRLVNRHSPGEIADAIEILIDVLDFMGGDPDVELNGDEEDSDGDERGDQAWAEWHTLRRPQQRAWHGLITGHEDDEEDDAAEEDDHSGDVAHEDDPTGHRQARWALGPGCPISDPGGVGEWC